jgi:GAF domain-containing protein
MADLREPFPGLTSALSTVLLSEGALDTTLQRVADIATNEIDGCDMAGITLLRRGEPVTAVFTDPAAPEIDSAQYETSAGPCLAAFRTKTVIRITDMRTETRWPAFARAALDHGVLSTISLPLGVGNGALGAMNLYSRSLESFDDEAVPLVFAAHAAVLLANAQAYSAAQELAGQLETAIASRAVIEQAKGIIMAAKRCSDDEAFAFLQQRSHHTNRKLRVIAADIVRNLSLD